MEAPSNIVVATLGQNSAVSTMMLAILLLVTLAAATPPPYGRKKFIITEDVYTECHEMYSGSHDIVDISIPMNNLNNRYSLKNFSEPGKHITLFFVEADIKDNGDKDLKGLFISKDGEIKKLLENGQTAGFSAQYKAYFGAKDGIYEYNHIDNTAEKYGNVNDSVIRIALNWANGDINYLTEDYVLYKFPNGKVDEITKVDAIKDARDIVFDHRGNLIFYNGSKQVYFYNGSTVEKITGLKANPTEINLIKAPQLLGTAYVAMDELLYQIRNDGTSEESILAFKAKPTAFAPEIYLIQYYAYNKKIYEYNLQSTKEGCKISDLEKHVPGSEENKSVPKTT